MDNRMESPTWLPDGAVPAVASDAVADRTEATPALDYDSGDAKGSFSYGDDRPYTYEEDGGFGYTSGSAYGSADAPAGGGYNREVSPSPDNPHVPPHQAQVPPTAAHAGRAGGGAGDNRTAVYGPEARVREPEPRLKEKATPARHANLVVARLEPWSVMKFSFLISLVAWVMLFVTVVLLYSVLSKIGVFASIQKTISSVTSSQSSTGVQLSKWISESTILGYTMLIGAINVVLITALSTVGAVIYNLVTHIGGGIEVTLREGHSPTPAPPRRMR